jgi:hypothetical protein
MDGMGILDVGELENIGDTAESSCREPGGNQHFLMAAQIKKHDGHSYSKVS